MGNRITGIHAIEEALRSVSYGSTLYLIRGDKRNISLEKAAIATGKVAVKKVSESEINSLCSSHDHRGAVLDVGVSYGSLKGGRIKEISVSQFISGLDDNKNYLVIALDGITDPHNLGAIIRSADQFSADLILLPERRSAAVNETVIRVASGSAQYVTVSNVVNLSKEINSLKDAGFWIYGADMSGNSSYETAFSSRSVLVMGSEGSGIRPLVRSNCDYMVRIPMSGHIDSLNVSVSAGILMYEYRRKFAG